MNCIFTICAKNYIGLARILGQSVRRYNPGVDFFIVVADEMSKAQLAGEDDNVLVAKSFLKIDENLWNNMAFKYNLTEFCTCIKPFCIEYFFEDRHYDTVCYLDPDTYLFSDFSYVYDKLEHFLVVTAPHVTIPQYPYKGELPDRSFLFNGISNFGFGAFRNSPKTLNIIRWWEDRLTYLCFGEMLWAVCTDQKWTDFFPAFLDYDEILFSNNLGLNLAPWNYFERKVVAESDGYHVVSRDGLSGRNDKLVFCHFAGYNYKQFAESGTVDNSSRMRISDLRHYSDIDPLVLEYAAEVHAGKDIFTKYLSLPYSYATFSNGVAIGKLHRRLYNGLKTNFGYEGNPFDVESCGLYDLMNRKKLIPGKNQNDTDSLNETNIGSFNRKLHVLYKLLRVFYRLVGYRNYVLFLQFARRISLYDMNTFLLGQEYENNKLR